MLNFCSIFICPTVSKFSEVYSFNTQADKVQWLRCGEAILEYKFFLKIIVAGELER